MSLQSVIRWLVPREDHFYGFVERQASIAHDAALALRRFKEGDAVADVREAVQKLEHDGDKVSHDMEDALAKTFVTPIDREDLQKLSTELDGILDLANGAIRGAALYGVEAPTESMGQLMDILVACTEVLKTTMPNLRKNAYSTVLESNRALQKLEKDGDAIFREAVSNLFKDGATDAKKLLREKEVLESLENAIDHCERVGETLALLAVKHG
jgi:predicted phosphate transport protein (TIGR00153 family)